MPVQNLPNNYRTIENIVVLSGITPKISYEVRYDKLYLSRKIKTTKKVLVISTTTKYSLSGNIEIEGLKSLNFDSLPIATEKPIFDNEGNLKFGGLNSDFKYENKAYIITGISTGQTYVIKYKDILILRKLKVSTKGIVKIRPTVKYPHSLATVLYLGTAKNYLALASLPLV